MSLRGADEWLRFGFVRGISLRFFTPIPGSISTGTAPIFSNANASAKKSGDGGTMESGSRSARVMFAAFKPCAMASESVWSSAKVMAQVWCVAVRIHSPKRRMNGDLVGMSHAHPARCDATLREGECVMTIGKRSARRG